MMTEKTMHEYEKLKEIVKGHGLLDKSPLYETSKTFFNLILLAIAIFILFYFDSLLVKYLDAVFLAFVMGQFGFIAHDSGHRQMAKSAKVDKFIGTIHANLFNGTSFSWWNDKHNKHHASPNIEEEDPDINIKVMAFSEKQALEKKGFAKFITKYQSYLFFFILAFEGYSMKASSFKFMFRKRLYGEFLLCLIHYVLYLFIVFFVFSFWQGIGFIALNQAFYGLYMASVFAPNHKGMPVFSKNNPPDYIRLQILTSRNIKPHPITDFWYGGLNYQIEHHLFPDMPRNKLRKTQKIVKDFCKERNIEYYETSWLRSFVEILQEMHKVSAPLRA